MTRAGSISTEPQLLGKPQGLVAAGFGREELYNLLDSQVGTISNVAWTKN